MNGNYPPLHIMEEIKNLKEEIAELKALANISYHLSSGIEINAGDDLNNYISVGNYYCPQSSDAQKIQNCPVANAFTLKVEHATGTAYPCQTLREFNSGTLRYRFYTASQKRWSEWR